MEYFNYDSLPYALNKHFLFDLKEFSTIFEDRGSITIKFLRNLQSFRLVRKGSRLKIGTFISFLG